ncbi:PH and Rap-GAP domain-containing protein DDB_G0271806-like isoform X1 [Ovis canadensis]|uniref:PH and Rap-GAP domain-containing protein DDB_G0271806-like isoform X1 n=1 Tax=Ovis canadensis TaxID=37174 RepID=UPI0037518748
MRRGNKEGRNVKTGEEDGTQTVFLFLEHAKPVPDLEPLQLASFLYRMLFPSLHKDFPSDSAVKESIYNERLAGDVVSIPGLGRSRGGRNGNPLQYSHLENPMDRGARSSARTAALSAPDPAAGHPRSTPPPETPQHSQILQKHQIFGPEAPRE